jgi:fatty-acyl-CoA synthase
MPRKTSMEDITRYRTLAEAIALRGQRDPDGRACVFIPEEGEHLAVSNGRLYDEIMSRAHGLTARGIGKGEIVLVALDHVPDLVACFWGAVCCGAVPSILNYWLPGSDADRYARDVGRMASAVRARAVVTLPELLAPMKSALAETGCIVLAAGDVVAGAGEAAVELPPVEEGDAALLQFTSGTTGAPKGLLFSHRAVLDHIAASVAAYGMTDDWVSVSWLPFYHDMGLIGHIRSLLHGDLFVAMAPRTWLRQPGLLMHAVHRYRGTLTNMPNFGFDYCTQRIRDEELAGVDLGSWRVITNGAEPVLPESMRRFAERFSAYGLRERVFAIGYGMAENICGISMTRPGDELDVDIVSAEGLHALRQAVTIAPGAPGARSVVSCGYPFRGVEIAIMNDDGRLLPDRYVGEIAVKSNTLFAGYHLDPEGAAGSFRDGWFLTGDLGYRAGGRLYVCGRTKDLIIVGGRNVQPHAVEDIAAAVAGNSAGRCAAIGVNDPDLGTEVPVLLIEKRRDMDGEAERRLAGMVRQAVSSELELALADVRFVPKGWLVKTTSGKLARAASRDRYLAEVPGARLDEAGAPPVDLFPGPIMGEVTRLFETVLGTGEIGPDDDFIRLGGDSLSALRLFVEVERRYGLKLPVDEFFERPTVAHLVELITRTGDEGGADCGLPGTSPVHDEYAADMGAALEHGTGPAYGTRLAFLTWLYRQRWSQRLFHRDIVRATRGFYALIEDPAQGESDAVQCAMLIRSPGGFQAQLLDRLRVNRPSYWTLKADTGPLERAYRAGKGVILAGRHAGLALLVREIARQRLSPAGYFSLKMAALFLPARAEVIPPRELKRSRLSAFLGQLLVAKRVLSGGGIVYILPDARDGLSRGIPVTLHGRLYRFKTGFAELALDTGAPVVPVSMGIDFPRREVTLSFLEPLDAGPADMPRAARIEGLVRQYVAYLGEEWRRWPGTVFMKHKLAHCDAPPAGRAAGSAASNLSNEKATGDGDGIRQGR